MPKEKGEIVAALELKGFRKENNDHEYYRYWTTDGKKSPVTTMFSHGAKGKEVDDGILQRMARQTKVQTMAQFRRLVECPMQRHEYEQILRDQNLIDPH